MSRRTSGFDPAVTHRKPAAKANYRPPTFDPAVTHRKPAAKANYRPPTFDPAYLAACIARLDDLIAYGGWGGQRLEDGMLKMREALVRAQSGDTTTDMRLLEKLAANHEYRGMQTENWVLRMLYPVKTTYRLNSERNNRK